MVYVISSRGKPLMSCENVVARLLLKDGKAKVLRRTPFTIKLLYDTTEYTQDVTLGLDTGSAHIGSAAVDEKNNVVYLSDIEIRNDIKDKMDQRRKYRRTRRTRKTRYRKARWNNRKNSIKTGRFSPTMRSKFQAHQKEVEFVKSILPVTRIVFETGTFDPHLMKNPLLHNDKIRHWGYQKGTNYGFENTKARILNRDNYTCQYCKGKRKDSKFEVHHIVFRCNGGSDEEDNLITLCHTCHSKLHQGKLKLDLDGSMKGQLKHATQMNSIRIQLFRMYPEAIETFGYITKQNRYILGVAKEHYLDACVIATGGNPFRLQHNLVYYKRCIPRGDYQRTKGVRSEMNLPQGKISGFKKFDKINYLGKEYFIKGRMSSGYAILMKLDGKKVTFDNASKGFKTPKLKNCKRLSGRKTWMITEGAVTQSIA